MGKYLGYIVRFVLYLGAAGFLIMSIYTFHLLWLLKQQSFPFWVKTPSAIELPADLKTIDNVTAYLNKTYTVDGAHDIVVLQFRTGEYKWLIFVEEPKNIMKLVSYGKIRNSGDAFAATSNITTFGERRRIQQ